MSQLQFISTPARITRIATVHARLYSAKSKD